MVTRTQKLLQYSSYFHLFQQKANYSAHAFFNKNQHRETLMQVGNYLKNEGQILRAGRVYKAIIDIYPTHKEAYQELWNCWIIRGLKVTAEEFDKFDKNYQLYIKPTEDDSPDCNGFKP